MSITGFRAVKELYKIAATFVSLMLPAIILVIFYAPAGPPQSNSKQVAAEQFDAWLALHDIFQSNNLAVFPDDTWAEFAITLDELPLQGTIAKIDVIKQVSSGTEVRSPTSITVSPPYNTSKVSEIELTKINSEPPVFSIASNDPSSPVKSYELVYIEGRDRIFVIPKGQGIKTLRQASNLIFRDKLARPNESEEILQGMRRHGWAAEPPDFQDLSIGNDIVRNLMKDITAPEPENAVPEVKVFGLSLPVSWVGVAVQVFSVVILFVLIMPTAALLSTVFHKNEIVIEDPDELPLYLQDKVLRSIASAVPLLTCLVAVYLFSQAKMAGNIFLDFGIGYSLAALAVIWVLVMTIAARGKFVFRQPEKN